MNELANQNNKNFIKNTQKKVDSLKIKKSKLTKKISDIMAQSPKAQEKAAMPSEIKELTLTDGTIVKCFPAKGKHVRQSQRLMDGDETKMIFAIIAVCATFNDKKITIEELDELPAKDVFALMGEYGGSF